MSLRATIRCRAGDFAVDAALEAEPGRPLALVGPNGAGKTTLVRALAGLLDIDKGTVLLDGVVLDNHTTHVPARQRSIGVVFQERALFDRMSAVENVAFGLRSRGVRAAAARAQSMKLLDAVGIGDRANAKPAQLSGGESQRVAIARALAHEPRLLLLDEPLSSLDVRARAEIRALLRRLLAGFGGVAIVVTHDPVDAMTLAEDVVVLENGRVTQSGTVDDVRAAPRTAYAAELVGINLFTGRLEPIGDGSATLRTPNGNVVVPFPPDLAGPLDDVIGLLRPADVAIYREQPSPGSARNVITGTVRSIASDGERARVRIDASPPLVADVTPGSVKRLGLTEGTKVWASFKAVEVRLVFPA
jgi:molybdate transport system ATP-binding protein